MLVTDLNNVRYLSGFTGSNGALLVFADDRDPVLATDGRYRTQAAEQAPGLEIAIERAVARHLVGRAADAGVGKLGFESNVVTVDGFDTLAGELEERKGPTELVRAAGTVEALREVKDAGELALLRLACEAADAALEDLVARGGLRPGRTEREVSRELEALMLDHGADGISFETIVAAGPNSAIPHHRPTDAVLAQGDFVKIDFGALVAGYHSDMTRTFVLGKAADWQLEIYQLVAESQRAGREGLAPGGGPRGGDAAARGPGGAAPGCRPARGGRRRAPADRRRGLRRAVQPRFGPWRGIADPRGAGNRRHLDRDPAGRVRGDRGARRLPARAWRCAHRGHAGGSRRDARGGPGIADQVPQGPGSPDMTARRPGKVADVHESIGRGLARLRDFRWDMYAQPMRELRLEMQIFFFSFHMPFGSGATLNVPVLTMIKPVSSQPPRP